MHTSVYEKFISIIVMRCFILRHKAELFVYNREIFCVFLRGLRGLAFLEALLKLHNLLDI